MRSKQIGEGSRFGRLVVASRGPNGEHQHARWNCRCDCGRDYLVRGTSLRSGTTTQCPHCRAEAGVATRECNTATDGHIESLALAVYNAAAKHLMAGVKEMQEIMDLAHSELKRHG